MQQACFSRLHLIALVLLAGVLLGCRQTRPAAEAAAGAAKDKEIERVCLGCDG